MKPQLQQSRLITPSSTTAKPKSLIPTQHCLTIATVQSLPNLHRRSSTGSGRVFAVSRDIQPVVNTSQEKYIAVKAIVTVQQSSGGFLSNRLDYFTDLFSKSLLLELVSTELDPRMGREKKPIEGYARVVSNKNDIIEYESMFEIKGDFGAIGAILVSNERNKEMYLKEIVLTGLESGPITFPCNSWVAPKSLGQEKRIFFSIKSYLPSQTPSGLKGLREKELELIRGNGQGERKSGERVYDYDVYNDLGNPDQSQDLARPVLGGKEHPYPRRCRTGLPRSKKDPKSESRSSSVYVPRDEEFSAVKQASFTTTTLTSVLKAVVPSIETALVDINLGFPFFTDIDSLYDDSLTLPPPPKQPKGIFNLSLARLIKAIQDTGEEILRFQPPEMLRRDKFAWLNDEEFSRQTLAGLNPLSIQLVSEFPVKSKLDPNVYGPPESAITKQLVECEIKTQMTLEEALEKKRLFIIDYHDLLLPYVNKVRELKGTTLYGSRTLFFLTDDGCLRPIAIELTRPPSPEKPLWKRVFTPGFDATSQWMWRVAKSHVLAHDSGYHELISHWLRTHASIEPYIIAANRQLSAMHPIYRLLHPHFRYTMAINALAREALINASGIIEISFSPLKYSMQLSSDAYAQLWQFDTEGLPGDLMKRGMAVEDATAEHGLKLTIEDYPYAKDGLLIWAAIEQWVSDYVAHYYPNNSLVSSDTELQAWWSEVRTKGHEDKKDEPWWPTLNTTDNLILVLTTIIWVASAHHAAVNFGQYAFGGYFPNRPTIMRTNVPVEDESSGWLEEFMKRPEAALLEAFPSKIQATVVMAVLELLSTHSPDEEYLGGVLDAAWAFDPVINASFERFSRRLKEIEVIIDERNNDIKLKNRTGAGIVPYELLKPSSERGVTGRGVPNSTSI